MSLIPIFTGGGGFLATGGTTYVQGGYRYHKFTSDGNFTVVKGSTTLEYLVVAGGGSGGNTNGPSGNSQYTSTGGGGGGGVLNGSYSSVSLQIAIGAGGSAFGTNNGGNSSILTNPTMGSPILLADAVGGGYGATGTTNAVVGGSGGGGSVKFDGTTQTRYTFANGTSGQGNAGAASSTDLGGGGGGSAGAAINNTGGLGLTTYTSWWDVSAPAQIAKGGNGDGPGTNGAANTGNGGGGARSADNALQSPGNGGSGIVIIRYAV
jgi:hypothetical protein